MNARTSFAAGLAGLALSIAAPLASGASFTVNWLDMSPTPFNTLPPNNSSYFMPGVGNVQITYTNDPVFNTVRLDQTPALGNQSVTNGPDTYSWGAYESFARVHAQSTPLNMPWSITYTFPSTLSAGQIVLGVSGLGRRDPNPGEVPQACITDASVQQNGTFLGEYIGANNWGPTQFTPAAGSFSMVNSLSGAGGADPWWNTGLALVRIDDAMNSLTVHFNNTAGDGVGLNIGVIVPTPGGAATLGLAGLAALGRRRRA